jgi:hypothetical protein
MLDEAGVCCAERLCENYLRGGKTTKTARFAASLVELSHKQLASGKGAAPKGREFRVFTHPPDKTAVGFF